MNMDTRRNPDGSLTVGIIEEEITIPEVKKEPTEVKKVEPKVEPEVKVEVKTEKPKAKPKAKKTKKK